MGQVKFSVAIRSTAYQDLINNTLGDKEIARQFVADISAVVSNNFQLSTCDAGSIISAGLVAQSLKLSLAPTLGYAYVVPYGNKAQFQIGYKGLIQLAQRSGQYKTIGARPVHKGEYVGQDKYGEDIFKFDHKYDMEEVVGYYAYFVLLNGFEKSIYWTKEQCESHGTRYSQAHKGKNRGGEFDRWSSAFDDMALKTVLKQLLSKWGIMSVELQKAVIYDQAVVNQDGTPDYVDNTEEVKEESDVNNHIIPEE